MKYFSKMRGVAQSPPRVAVAEVVWSWIGAFVGIAAVSWLHGRLVDSSAQIYLIASFGASAVLLYGAPRSPLAQPRNALGGHVLSALVGVCAQQSLGAVPWLAAAVAVATAIGLMHLTKTLHPPGGATALGAVIGGASVHRLGYGYALVPVGLGAVILVLIALAVNNIPKSRRYPEFWL